VLQEQGIAKIKQAECV